MAQERRSNRRTEDEGRQRRPRRRSTGKSMVLALLDGVVLRIGLSWLFGIALNWGFFGFVLGYGLAPYGYAIPSVIYFLSGIWKRRRVLAEDI